MERKTRLKKCYIPGVISLTILPLSLILFAKNEIKRRTLTVLPLTLADTNLPKRYPGFFAKFDNLFPPKRSYFDFALTGNNENDNLSLESARAKIRLILSKNDPTNGVHFHFDKNCEYWTFVKTVDILRAGNAKTYMALDSDIWFYHFLPDTTTVALTTLLLEGDVEVIRPKISWWSKLVKTVKTSWKSSWQLILAFSALLLTTIYRRRINGR
jgi:hypothetical protein